MNTNRGSYVLGAALGSALVLGLCVNAHAADIKDVNVPNQSVFYGDDHTNTNFAWALYAGTSYDVTPQIALDLTYRYANLGTAKSGVVTAFDNSNSYSGEFIKNISSNDLMLGFRYKFQREVPVYAVK